jgi:hypothetical protein
MAFRNLTPGPSPFSSTKITRPNSRRAHPRGDKTIQLLARFPIEPSVVSKFDGEGQYIEAVSISRADLD